MNPMIIAHSFGCRIALWYSYIYGTSKLVLTGAAGIQSRKNRIQKLKEMEYHNHDIVLEDQISLISILAHIDL